MSARHCVRERFSTGPAGGRRANIASTSSQMRVQDFGKRRMPSHAPIVQRQALLERRNGLCVVSQQVPRVAEVKVEIGGLGRQRGCLLELFGNRQIVVQPEILRMLTARPLEQVEGLAISSGQS